MSNSHLGAMNGCVNGRESPGTARPTTSTPPVQPIPISSVTITHTSSQNATIFTVSSPTKKQSVISIAKKSTSPSKFFNNSSAYGVRSGLSSFNIGTRFQDLSASASGDQRPTVDENGNGNRLRKCVVKVTELENGSDRHKLKRLSLTDSKNAAKRFDDGAVKKSNLTSSKSFNAGPFQSKKQQLARSNSITNRRMDAGQCPSNGQNSLDSRNGSSLDSTVSFFNELIFKHFKTNGQPSAPGKCHSNLKSKLQEELEKPLKLYAFMSLRHQIHPLFLNRNLSYLKKAHKNSLPNEKSKKLAINATKRRRKQYQIDNILATKLQQRSLTRTLSQEFTDDVTFCFEKLVTNDDDVVSNLAEIYENDSSSLVMESFVEVYGLKTLSFRSTSDSSTTVQLVNDPPVLLGKCPIAINDQPAVSATIKLSLKNIVGDASFFPYVYFRFVVLFKKPSEAPRSPRKSTSGLQSPRMNGHHHHSITGEQPVECYKEFVLVCSLTMTSADQSDVCSDANQQPVNLRLDESRNWNVKLEVKQIPKRILFDRPTSDSETRPKFGQLSCWPIYQPLSLARPVLNSAVQSVQLKSLRKSRRDYVEEEILEESEDEVSQDEDSRPKKSSKSRQPAPTNAKRAKALVKKERPTGRRQEEHQDGSVISDDRLEQLIKQSMSQGDFVDLRISATRSAMAIRSRSAVRTEQFSPTSSKRPGKSPQASPVTVSKSNGGKSRNGKNGHATTNVFYEFYSNKAAPESKKHQHGLTNGHSSKKSENGFGGGGQNGISKTKYLTEMSIDDLPGLYSGGLKKLICPFCYLLCNHAYNLLQHMLACHPRFQIHLSLASTFGSENGGSANGYHSGSSLVHSASCTSNFISYQSGHDGLNGKTAKKIQFEISAEDKYDGSYAFSPYDLFESAHVGYSQSRLGPSKRIPVTYVLVHKKTGYIDLSRYSDMTPAQIQALNMRQQQQVHLRTEMQPNKAFNCQDGMERIYYHTKTCMPILADEIDIDSDSELDPDWLKEYTAIQINDFDDVNRGEKDLMLLWNLHVLRSNYIADQQMYQACEDFVDANIGKLVEMKLIRNFFVHLRSLYDYGLLKVTEMLKLIEYVSAKETELLTGKMPPAIQEENRASTSGQVRLKAEPEVKGDSFQLGEFIRNTINKSPLASRLLGKTFYTKPQTPSPSKASSPVSTKKSK